MTYRLFLPLLAALHFCASPIPAQVGGELELIQTITGQASYDQVGRYLGRSIDVDGDGLDDLLVGCSGDTARVYSSADGSILYEWQHGHVIENAGDIDLDGTDDIIIGGYADQVTVLSGASGSTIYSHSDSVWTGFGYAVNGAGDVNADGVPDYIVGARNQDHGTRTSCGMIYVFSGADGSELFRVYGQNKYGHFGSYVTGLGDINGDGFDDFGVGEDGDVDYPADDFCQIFSGKDQVKLFEYLDGIEPLKCGDMDGDGVADFAYRNPWWLHFVSAVTGATISSHMFSGGFVIEDLDGDGRNEFASRNINWGSGTETFIHSGVSGVAHAILPISTYAEMARLEDTNGDGSPNFAIGYDHYGAGGLIYRGRVDVYRFHPLLSLNAPSLTASGTQSVDASLNFPASEAGELYCVLVSATGVGPIQAGPVFIPLTDDTLFYAALQGFADNVFVFDRIGVLDGNGDGTASMVSHPALAAFAGMDLYFAAVTFGTGRVRMSSAVTKLEILP